MTITRLRNVTVNSPDPARLVAFWTTLLGVEVLAERGDFTWLTPLGPGQPRLLVQRGVRQAAGAGPIHLDFESDDLERDCAAATELGGAFVREVEQMGNRWRVMEDPDGNVFCLVARQRRGETSDGRPAHGEQATPRSAT